MKIDKKLEAVADRVLSSGEMTAEDLYEIDAEIGDFNDGYERRAVDNVVAAIDTRVVGRDWSDDFRNVRRGQLAGLSHSGDSRVQVVMRSVLGSLVLPGGSAAPHHLLVEQFSEHAVHQPHAREAHVDGGRFAGHHHTRIRELGDEHDGS